MKALLTTLAGLTLAAASAAQTVLPQGSEISFVSRQMGVPVEGRFGQWQAELRFDPKNPAAGHVRLSIDTGSARLGSPDSERELSKSAWFDIGSFPQARFESSAVRSVGPGRYAVDGRLTIKGRSQALTVPVVLDGSTASGSFTLKRLAFAIGDGEWADTSMVADEVQVRFRLQLAGLQGPS